MAAPSEARIIELRGMYGEASVVLHGGNVYTPGKGYETDHILPIHRRDRPEHWNGQFQNAEAFSKEWKPRPGPLELIHNLAQRRSRLHVLNMGAGLGDFTVNLAQIPNVQVLHVDFSERANEVARANVIKFGVERTATVLTADHRVVMRAARERNLYPDVIFFYGGLTDNIPKEETSAEILRLAAEVVHPEGLIWYVGLQQPAIIDPTDMRAIDIEGEYPTRPGFVSEVLEHAGMVLVKEDIGPRPDNHPLIPGGPSEEHMHIVHRALYYRPTPGVEMNVPDFGFKDAVDPNWGAIWQSITARPE